MTLTNARTLAHTLLNKHGLHDWTFAFNRRKRAFGLCDFRTRTVYLSAVLTELNDEAEVNDTLLHEIAHALAGHRAGHGPVWRKIAHDVGAKPRRCYRTEEVRQPPGRYLLVCPSCQASVAHYRKPTRVYACRSCFDRHNQGRFSVRYQLRLQLLQP